MAEAKQGMTDFNNNLPVMGQCWGTLPSMRRKFDRYARRDFFRGHTREEFDAWQSGTRSLLHGLLGLDKMESCALSPVLEDVVRLPGGIRREHIRIQVEPDVWMPMFVLVPPGAGHFSRPFLCPPGHNGAGKYSVAGLYGYGPVREKIRQYHYDYGHQLAMLGYVAICPDCRGFGERREDLEDTKDLETAMKGDCRRLAHMGEPLGIPVAGMLAWDLMRAVDYLMERGEWDLDAISCLGFSGGGMQTLWLSAMDERVRLAVISGYMYGYRGCAAGPEPELFLQLCASSLGTSGYGGYCQPDCPQAPSYPVLFRRPAQRSTRDCQCHGTGGHYPERIQAAGCARPHDS